MTRSLTRRLATCKVVPVWSGEAPASGAWHIRQPPTRPGGRSGRRSTGAPTAPVSGRTFTDRLTP
jgi:hypothetical protein